MEISRRKGRLSQKQRMSWFYTLPMVLTILLVVAPPCQCCPQSCTCNTNKVDCAGKGLTSLPNDFPIGMTELYFSGNALTALGADAFITFTQLEILDLSDNHIESVVFDSFDSLTSLRQLNLQGNKLRNLPANAFTDLTRVHTVDLSRNPLDGFPKGVFESLTYLSTLKMMDAGLRPQAFVDMQNVVFLENLDISGNNFSYLPYLMLQKYSRLKHLTIRNAGVKYIDPNAFVGLLSLQYLKLDGNNISRISREMFQPLDKLSSLYLQGNQLVCDCGIAQFMEWRKQVGAILDGTTTCMQSNGKSIDIKTEDLSHLCSAVGPPTTTPSCGENVRLNMRVSDLKHDEVKVILEAQSLPSDLLISTNVRLYGKGTSKKDDRWEELNVSKGSHVFKGLTPGTSYVLCLIQYNCALYSCVDFTTEVDPKVGALKDPVCISVEVTAGVAAAAAFITLTIGMITIYLILRGVCCCPSQNKDEFTPPDSPVFSSGISKRTQHVMPMQLSHSYIPSSHPRLQSSSSVGDTYDAILLEPIDGSGKIFHNPSYRHKERPRNVNDPLPIPENRSHTEHLAGSPDSTHQMIQGISSAYLHPDIAAEPSVPHTYLEPAETLKRQPSTKRADPTTRHTMNGLLSNSDPYHVYQEAMDDVIDDMPQPRPRSSEDHPSPAMLKKQFANKLPSLDDMRRQMEMGTGRLKKFRRPALQGDSRSISTPNILTADDKTRGTHQIQSEA